jgi:hypothetical protein
MPSIFDLDITGCIETIKKLNILKAEKNFFCKDKKSSS